MKKALLLIVLIIIIMILAIGYGRLTYFLQEKYGLEWFWVIIRQLPLILVIIYNLKDKNKI